MQMQRDCKYDTSIHCLLPCAVLTVHSVLAGRPVHTEDALPDVAVLRQTGPDGYCPSSLGWGKCTEWDMYQQWSCDV